MAITCEQQINANHNRRMANESRMIDRWDSLAKREESAETMLGELCREGKPVYYVVPIGGRYREGSKADLVAFLVRNNYA